MLQGHETYPKSQTYCIKNGEMHALTERNPCKIHCIEIMDTFLGQNIPSRESIHYSSITSKPKPSLTPIVQSLDLAPIL